MPIPVLMLLAAAPTPPVQGPEEVLDLWHLAAARADEAQYFSLMTPDAVFLGTDATERWTLDQFRAFAHPYFAKGKAWSFRALKRTVAFNGDRTVAWFDEALDTPNMGPCRGSGVLVKVGKTWRIAHYNLSVPIPNALMGQVKALIEADAKKR
jgi:ketosteroid isomerase-like protein